MATEAHRSNTPSSVYQELDIDVGGEERCKVRISLLYQVPVAVIILFPLVVWNYRQRIKYLIPDKVYWADRQLARWGYWWLINVAYQLAKRGTEP